MSNSTAEWYIARAHVVTSQTPFFPESRSVAVRACVYDLRLRNEISFATAFFASSGLRTWRGTSV
jgi:hypothetical protein